MPRSLCISKMMDHLSLIISITHRLVMAQITTSIEVWSRMIAPLISTTKTNPVRTQTNKSPILGQASIVAIFPQVVN